MTFVWSHGPTGLPHTIRIFWRVGPWSNLGARGSRRDDYVRLLMGTILATPRLLVSANRRSDCLQRVLRGCKAGDRTRQHRRSYHRAHQWKPLLQVANDHRETVDTMPAR